MMEQRRALTIPFTVDKDNLMENPLKIPRPCLSSECGRLGGQVSWTTFADYKHRRCGSQHKNGSILFDHSLATLDMSRRRPCLILTDVLKTEQGKAYMDRVKPSRVLRTRASATPRRSSGRHREEPLICREVRSRLRNDENNGVTPKCNRKPTNSSTRRSKQKKFQNADEEVDMEENKDIEEVIIGKDNRDDFKFAEVVDCGLSVSWEPAGDTGSCDGFSPASIKDRLTDPEKEVERSLKRKRRDTGSQCNGTGTPKHHRESVLRLTGEDGRAGAPVPTCPGLEESGEDGYLDTLDRTIVQFTVGEDDRREVLLPIAYPNLNVQDSVGTPMPSLSSSQCNTSITGPSEPIVLSSDDEESGVAAQRCSPALHTMVTVNDAVIQGQSSQDDVAEQQEACDLEEMQVLRVVVDHPGPVEVSPIPTIDFSFSMLHCGRYKGKANGDVMITEKQIVIPLKDPDDQTEAILTLERNDLKRYSIWEQKELEDRELHYRGDVEPYPAAFLLLYMAESAAAAAQQQLLELKQDGATDSDKMSPFFLMTLKGPVVGMEGALLKSLLDIDCLNCLGNEKSLHRVDRDGYDFLTPVLSLDDSVELIRRTGLDSHLLSLLGLESPDTSPQTGQDEPPSDTDKDVTPHIPSEVRSPEETMPELETETERDTATQLRPEEEQKEQTQPSEKTKEEPPPVYTLCHRRTNDSYSVSLCKPHPSLSKFKHQGLARRLIQFPPPPLKGGITVTMEDLRCLDTGHFLNDVIIDFYLKYLLQNASAAVAERSHIFSSFFYKQLTRRDNASEGATSDFCQRQRRHSRVKTWTRHVDIFKKDFLFVPVNQEAHWYLVVICFPGLDEPKCESWSGPNSESPEQEEARGSESPKKTHRDPAHIKSLRWCGHRSRKTSRRFH